VILTTIASPLARSNGSAARVSRIGARRSTFTSPRSRLAGNFEPPCANTTGVVDKDVETAERVERAL
jgi:hypothetical protein